MFVYKQKQRLPHQLKTINQTKKMFKRMFCNTEKKQSEIFSYSTLHLHQAVVILLSNLPENKLNRYKTKQ